MIPIQAKIAMAAGAVLLLIAALMGIHAHGDRQGTNAERVKWQKIELARAAAEAMLVAQHGLAMAKKQRDFDAINLKVSEDHETELYELRLARDADRAAADRAGGLRIPGAVCNKPAAPALAASERGRDEDTAASIRLPRQVENDLWAIVNDADEIVEQARSCQVWIRKHGFYGSNTTVEAAMHGKIVAVATQHPRGTDD